MGGLKTMLHKAVSRLILAGGLSLALPAQNSPKAEPIPGDPLEIVTGQVSAVDAMGRSDALGLLQRARSQYELRGAGRGYDLKVAFTVKSGGQTEHDGAWEMEDVFDPKQGLRWTAKAADGYAITRISSNGMLYGEDGASYVPLRLHEARAALFDPIASLENVKRASIRTSTAVYQGSALTCVLLSGSGRGAPTVGGRRWDETEECIDPQSGFLKIHSPVPGRSYAYDYSGALPLAGRVMPRQVVVTEGGRTVTTITVESLTEVSGSDASFFLPTAEMRAKGRPIGLGGAQKIWRSMTQNPSSGKAAAQTVCVFGVVTPSGQLMEAHSLQPANPNSALAISAAKQMSFSRSTPTGDQPQQYFVFVFESFGITQ
jgi:hypothetical protein